MRDVSNHANHIPLALQNSMSMTALVSVRPDATHSESKAVYSELCLSGDEGRALALR